MFKLLVPTSGRQWFLLVFTTTLLVCALVVPGVFLLFVNPWENIKPALLLAVCLSVPVVGVLYGLLAKMAEMGFALQKMAVTDQLTGLPNRAAFYTAALADPPLMGPHLVLMLDIDHFKQVNDTHGHLIGDECLFLVARHLERYVRPVDQVCRYGGEEFAVVLRDQDPSLIHEMSMRVAEGWTFDASIGRITLTFSIGIASWTPDQRFEEALQNADTALYRAKEMGRARAAVYDEPVPADAIAMQAG
ncbi:MAG: GGDEF domain-containing protein [Pseudomonadota bacterium]